ncbi:MAG: hypothetical protein ACE144_21165 [Thermodesulfobacteriota bacterium]
MYDSLIQAVILRRIQKEFKGLFVYLVYLVYLVCLVSLVYLVGLVTDHWLLITDD